MNILDAEDLIKGLPDDALTQEAQAPSGQVPQFLVVSEIQRRTDMRKRYENDQQQNQGTVAEQIVQEGIAGMMPQQPMGMPPQGMPQGMPPQMPQGMPPMGMAQGGIVRMAGGGMPGAYGLYGLQKEYIDPLLDRAKILAQTARVSVEEAYEVLKREAAMNMPNYGMVAPSGDDLPSVSDVVSRGAKSFEGANPYGLGDLAGSIKKGITSLADLEFGAGPYGLPAEAGTGIQSLVDSFGSDTQKAGVEPADSPIAETLPLVQEKQTDASDPGARAELSVMDDYFGSNPFTKPAGGKEVQSVSKIQQQSLPSELAPSELSFANLIADSRRMAGSNALMQLGAGIAGGNLSQGISAAGMAANKGMQDARSLEMKERLAKYQAGREDAAREEKAEQFTKTFGLSEKKLEALIEQNASTTQREALRTLVSLFEGELDQTKKAGYSSQIQQILAELRGAPNYGVPTSPQSVGGAARPSLASYER